MDSICKFIQVFLYSNFLQQHKTTTIDPTDPVKGLIKLYAHKSDAIYDLEKCRINPDFNSDIRIDLEFYIPQICSMVMHLDDPHDVINLILNASKQSNFFSHRILFFFQSTIFSKDELGKRKQNEAEELLGQLKKICIESQQILCLVNS